MPGGKIVYVPMLPPKDGATRTQSASEWVIDFDKLESAITDRTKMLVINTPRKHRTNFLSGKSHACRLITMFLR